MCPMDQKLAQYASTLLDFQAEYVGFPSSPQQAIRNPQMGAERTEQRDEGPWVVPAWDHLNFSQNKWPMTRETGKSGRI